VSATRALASWTARIPSTPTVVETTGNRVVVREIA